MSNYIVIGIGGFIGAVLRYLAELYTPCPYCSTVLVNSIGSFGLAFISALLINLISIPNWMKLSVTIGFFGSFTTFSTFSLEALQLLQKENVLYFFTYSGFNLIFGLLSAGVAFFIVHRLERIRKET